MRFRRSKSIFKFILAIPVIWFVYIAVTVLILDKSSDQFSRSKYKETYEHFGNGVNNFKAEVEKNADILHADDQNVHENPKNLEDNIAVNDEKKENHLAPLIDKAADEQKELVGKNNAVLEEEEDIESKREKIREQVKVAEEEAGKALVEMKGVEVEENEKKDELDEEVVVFNPDDLKAEGQEKVDKNGPGEGGAGVNINRDDLTEDQKKTYDAGWTNNQFNQYASDMISLHRSLNDSRIPECKNKEYPLDKLPDTSVVIVFHNEAWSTLLRTVHSVIDRSPPRLLREVILVDDLSDMQHLKAPLDKYVNKLDKVKLVRSPIRIGLTRARILGFEASKGKTVTFLDSHCECFPGWLEPLMYRIFEDKHNVIFPTIESINASTFLTQTSIPNDQGVFDIRSLIFLWRRMPQDISMNRKPTDAIRFDNSPPECETPHSGIGWLEPLLDRIYQDSTHVVYPMINSIDANTFYTKNFIQLSVGIMDIRELTFRWKRTARPKDPVVAIRSPTMPGGLFTIDREYFKLIGTYDPGLDYWGGENMELSFKTWMCNGSVEIIPCSNVGHVFRKKNPITWPGGGNIARRNSIRVAEVWMDEYKYMFYERINNDIMEFGDVSDRKKLRKELNCKSFDWYVKNIYPELDQQNDAIKSGELVNDGQVKCIDSYGDQKLLRFAACHHKGYNQFWQLTDKGQIRQTPKTYLCVNGDRPRVNSRCKGNPEWVYQDDRTLMNPASGKCLQPSMNKENNRDFIMTECRGTQWQKWRFALKELPDYVE